MLSQSLWMLTLVGLGVGVMAVGNPPDWGFQSYLGMDYTLTCNHSNLMVERYNAITWELPDKSLVMQSTEKYTLANGMSNQVVDMHLTIKNVQESDAGVYVCHLYRDINRDQKLGFLLRGLNLGGHKYRDAIDEYRHDIMVGGIAAVVLFVPLVTACLVYKFRYQTAEQKRAKLEARKEATRHQRYLEANGKGTELSEVKAEGGEINPGYENVGDSGTRL